jgi:hypothetical protein
MLARARADASHHIDRDWLSRLQGMVSGTPDTSATLYGPVHLGPNSGFGIETAKTQKATPSGNANIVATPVNEKSLASGKPAEATANPNNDSEKAKESDQGKSQPTAATPTEPAKKKGHFHALKKIVKPF